LDETEQPFDDEEGDEGGDDETEGEIEQELVVAAEEVVAGAEEVEGTGGEDGGDAEEQGEFGRGGALCAQGHGGHDAGSGAGGAGEDDGEDLAEADGDRFRPGNVLVGVEFLGEKFDGKDDETAGEDGPSDGEERCGEFEVEVLGEEKADKCRDDEGGENLEEVGAIFAFVEVTEQVGDFMPVDEDDGEDGPGLDDEVKDVGLVGVDEFFGE